MVILGINNPLSVAAISNLAEALGEVVPIPVCANSGIIKNNPKIKDSIFAIKSPKLGSQN
jgi:hypothetical protein